MHFYALCKDIISMFYVFNHLFVSVTIILGIAKL